MLWEGTQRYQLTTSGANKTAGENASDPFLVTSPNSTWDSATAATQGQSAPAAFFPRRTAHLPPSLADRSRLRRKCESPRPAPGVSCSASPPPHSPPPSRHGSRRRRDLQTSS